MPLIFFRRSVVFLVLLAGVGCHKSASPQAEDTPTATADESQSQPLPTPPEKVKLPSLDDGSTAWLTVNATRGDAPGGWASGSFDAARNRIEIRTRDVRGFLLDTSRIAIDWDRLVVISIDGKNSELRRRERPFLHFQLDEHGGWIVQEP